MNDNSPNIKFTPSKDGNYRAVGTNNKPAGAPTAAKDFRKIYKKTESSEDESQQARADALEEGLEDQTVQRPAPRSLFDLPVAHKEVATAAHATQPQFPKLAAAKNKPGTQGTQASSPFAAMPQAVKKSPQQSEPQVQMAANASVNEETEVAMADQTFVAPETAEETAPPQTKNVPDQAAVATKPRTIVEQAAVTTVATPKNVVATNQDAEKSVNIYAKEDTPKAQGTERPMVTAKSSSSSKANASGGGFSMAVDGDKRAQSQGALAETDADASQGQADHDVEIVPKGQTVAPQAKVAVAETPVKQTGVEGKSVGETKPVVGEVKPSVVAPAPVKEPAAPAKTVSSETGETVVPLAKPPAGQEKVEVKEGSKVDLAAPKRTYLHTEFTREQPDLSYVNPFTIAAPAPAVAIAPEAKVERPMPISAELQLLIDKLATEMTVVQQGGQTETTVELKHPPLFDGARVTLTSFETAKNEFNIRFENLTQAAQHVLGQQVYRQELLSNLEQKGYNVHIFTATTFDDARTIAANVDTPNKGRDEQARERENQGGGQQRQRQK